MHDMRALFATNENRYTIILVFAFIYNTIIHDRFPLSNHIALDKKVIFRWLCFPQVVQKQTLSEVGN